MADPVVATGSRATALPATVRTSRVAETVRTNLAVATGPTSPAVATARTSRAAGIGPNSQAATGHSRHDPASTDLRTRERCQSGWIRAG